jgi:L-glyceraldehyde 3-phosphate reductase
VRSGKALYAGISSYNSRRTAEAAAILRAMGTPALINQPSYSILNRWIEEDHLLDALAGEGMGCIVFSPLAQGLLTDKYLDGVPPDSRAAKGADSWRARYLAGENLAAVAALNEIARRRGQSLAQMAIAWVLRDPRMTSALIGASRVEQIADAVGALQNLDFDDAELAAIDAASIEAGVNLWRRSSTA